MNFGTETGSGKAGSIMDWSTNNPYKTLKDMEPKSMMDLGIIPNVDSVNIGLNPSEKGNCLPALKSRKKTMTSVYLKFFETAADGKTRTCKFCGQSYSIATATGNLGRHLANRHPGYDKAGDATAISNSTSQPTVVTKKAQPQPKAEQLDYDHLNWLLIKWLVLTSVPPSTLEDKWLVNSYKFLNPSIQLWPGEKYRSVLGEVFRTMQEDVRASLEQCSSRVSITIDFWTSFEQIFYMSVTCQWIDENWCFQKVLLDICHVPYPCRGEEIHRSLVKVLRFYNIESRVLSCTHDNSQTAMHACHKLKEDLDSLKFGPFCYIPCAAQTLNMIIEDGLRTIRPLISRIREFVMELNASSNLAEDFIQMSSAYHEGSWKFPLDASARWSGNYQMLDIVRKAGKSIEAVIRKYEDTLGSRILLTVADRNAVNIMHQYLEPFFKTTNNICTKKVLTVGLVLFFMDHISETISTYSRDSPDLVKRAADDMGKKARNYHDQVCNIFTYMTAILDPRIKGELLPESLNSEIFLEEARAHFIRYYCNTGHFPAISSGCNAQDFENGSGVSFAEEIARKKRRASMSTATDELTQYLSEAPALILTDVLEWWKVNSTRYPRLSVMARDFLAVQPTSVLPEDVFCGKGDEIYRQRFCMPYNSTQAVLCIKSWIEVGFKMKFKSDIVDYEWLMELAVAAATTNSGNANSDKKQK